VCVCVCNFPVFCVFTTSLQSELRSLHNYSGVFAVVLGLSLHSVTRLNIALPNADDSALRELTLLVDGQQNYKVYRAQLAATEAHAPVVPYLGLITSAVTFVEDGNPTRIDSKINREKVHLMWNILSEFFRWNLNVYPLLDIFDVQQWLLHELTQPEVSEERLYELSYKVKPNAGVGAVQ
jgi:hypothetical protein